MKILNLKSQTLLNKINYEKKRTIQRIAKKIISLNLHNLTVCILFKALNLQNFHVHLELCRCWKLKFYSTSFSQKTKV